MTKTCICGHIKQDHAIDEKGNAGHCLKRIVDGWETCDCKQYAEQNRHSQLCIRCSTPMPAPSGNRYTFCSKCNLGAITTRTGRFTWRADTRKSRVIRLDARLADWLSSPGNEQKALDMALSDDV